jgi:hypothetical protein
MVDRWRQMNTNGDDRSAHRCEDAPVAPTQVRKLTREMFISFEPLSNAAM